MYRVPKSDPRNLKLETLHRVPSTEIQNPVLPNSKLKTHKDVYHVKKLETRRNVQVSSLE
jgi:hypothetical protein